jgi:hypothetical protein
MDLGSIFLILALAVLVSLFISRPFMNPEQSEEAEDQREESAPALDAAQAGAAQRDHELSTLLAERERILSTLQELEFDHALNKIPEEDYPEQRSQLLEEGAQVLRQLEALGKAAPLPVASAAADGTSRLEPANGKQLELDELEDLISARRRARSETVSGFCPKCGKPLQKSDRFCSRCGTPINVVESGS